MYIEIDMRMTFCFFVVWEDGVRRIDIDMHVYIDIDMRMNFLFVREEGVRIDIHMHMYMDIDMHMSFFVFARPYPASLMQRDPCPNQSRHAIDLHTCTNDHKTGREPDDPARPIAEQRQKNGRAAAEKLRGGREGGRRGG